MASNFSKRPQPSAELLAWRKQYLRKLSDAGPYVGPVDTVPSLEPGNSKTGTTGKFYQRIFVWNLPAMVSCPGASEYCKSLCYNADMRTDAFPFEKWRNNHWWAVNRTNDLREHLISELAEAPVSTAVRIHSSGDFFNSDYIQMWCLIAESLPNVSFWAYTRSWTTPTLFPLLSRLRALPNVQLFASWDVTMPPPPLDWRISYVQEGRLPLSTSGLIPPSIQQQLFYCPEQSGQTPNCASCGFCIRSEHRGVLFDLH